MTPLLIAMLGWIAVESVVLRWHDLVDLPAGLLRAGLVILVANRVCHRLEAGAGARALVQPGDRLERGGALDQPLAG